MHERDRQTDKPHGTETWIPTGEIAFSEVQVKFISSRSRSVGVAMCLGVLPTDVTEMAMDEIQDTVRSRDPIVRVDDPEYRSLRHSKSGVCCCTSPRTTCHRRLFIIAGITALLTATALLVILVYLIITRPVL